LILKRKKKRKRAFLSFGKWRCLKLRLNTEKLARRQMLGKGTVQALRKARSPLKLENRVVLMKSFHFN